MAWARGLNGGRIRLEIIEQPWCGRNDFIEFFLNLGLHLLAQCRGSSRARVATCQWLCSRLVQRDWRKMQLEARVKKVQMGVKKVRAAVARGARAHARIRIHSMNSK